MIKQAPSALPRLALALAFCVALLSALLSIACGSEPECEQGLCLCEEGATCDFVCEEPPCQVECSGDNPECKGGCANGDCLCGSGSTCEMTCESGPCHADCLEGSSCVAECFNGDCTCGQGSNCDFSCGSGPCHVTCEGQHERCDGECENGTCLCGAGSTCEFVCNDHNCNTICEAGSSCILSCPTGPLDQQGCRFDTCAEGEAEVCPDGKHIVCNAECPPPEDETDAADTQP